VRDLRSRVVLTPDPGLASCTSRVQVVTATGTTLDSGAPRAARYDQRVRARMVEGLVPTGSVDRPALDAILQAIADLDLDGATGDLLQPLRDRQPQ
jgi:hypothetical protein